MLFFSSFVSVGGGGGGSSSAKHSHSVPGQHTHTHKAAGHVLRAQVNTAIELWRVPTAKCKKKKSARSTQKDANTATTKGTEEGRESREGARNKGGEREEAELLTPTLDHVHDPVTSLKTKKSRRRAFKEKASSARLGGVGWGGREAGVGRGGDAKNARRLGTSAGRNAEVCKESKHVKPLRSRKRVQ